MVVLRFRIRRVGNRYIGECLETGAHVESSTREEARQLLDDAYRAWDKGVALLENAGRTWEFSHVPLYPLRRFLFDISYVVVHLRLVLAGPMQLESDSGKTSTSGFWRVPRLA